MSGDLSIFVTRWLPGDEVLPIFDQLVTDQRWSPFSDMAWPPAEWSNFPTACPICGVIDPSQFPVSQYDDPICIECWQRNRHLEPELWHCADCGKYLAGFDAMIIATPSEVIHLCRKHFDDRCTCAMTESSMHACVIHGQNGGEL